MSSVVAFFTVLCSAIFSRLLAGSQLALGFIMSTLPIEQSKRLSSPVDVLVSMPLIGRLFNTVAFIVTSLGLLYTSWVVAIYLHQRKKANNSSSHSNKPFEIETKSALDDLSEKESLESSRPSSPAPVEPVSHAPESEDAATQDEKRPLASRRVSFHPEIEIAPTPVVEEEEKPREAPLLIEPVPLPPVGDERPPSRQRRLSFRSDAPPTPFATSSFAPEDIETPPATSSLVSEETPRDESSSALVVDEDATVSAVPVRPEAQLDTQSDSVPLDGDATLAPESDLVADDDSVDPFRDPSDVDPVEEAEPVEEPERNWEEFDVATPSPAPAAPEEKRDHAAAKVIDLPPTPPPEKHVLPPFDVSTAPKRPSPTVEEVPEPRSTAIPGHTLDNTSRPPTPAADFVFVSEPQTPGLEVYGAGEEEKVPTVVKVAEKLQDTVKSGLTATKEAVEAVTATSQAKKNKRKKRKTGARKPARPPRIVTKTEINEFKLFAYIYSGYTLMLKDQVAAGIIESLELRW